MITAPYNFVPLNKEVFYPSWSEDVSHDVPFQDGESGEIDITITAKSPIFIRDHQDPEQFYQHNGQYYIPGSSVKGMIRNVLEIMSFSKMNTDTVGDKTYAIRDLRNKELYMSKMKPQNTFCGWLKKEGNNYLVEDCGVPGRIKQEEIDQIFNIKFAKKFKAPFNNKGEFKNKPQFKTAKYKYSLLKDKNLTLKFKYVKKDNLREIYKQGDDKLGTIVLTGQASARKDKGKFDAKIYEFIFFESKKTLPLSSSVFDNFKFAYFDGRKTEPKESPDWTYWKQKLNNGGKIPVFFQKKDGLIQHIGLSYLYKLPYNNSIHGGIYDSHTQKSLDMAQTIFGYTNDQNSLKGRAQCSHFKSVKNEKVLSKRTEILGTPRASYYPMYVYQKGKIYSTYMDDDFIIAGRKRYPIHKGDKTKQTTDTGNKNVGTTFAPLAEGVVFKGKLRFHNLKKEEAGALISALTFHNTPNTYHSIGMAKPLGYGKVTIKIENIDIKEYIGSFENIMVENIDNWLKSGEIRELLTMSTEQNNSGESKLEYIDLPEFADAKNKKDFLRRYTKLKGIKAVRLKSIKNIKPQKSTAEMKNDKEQSIKSETNKISQENLNIISKTKMRKAITESWNRVFKIFYHPNQINEFIQGKFKTTPKEQAIVYEKLKDNKKFKTIIEAIDDFNQGKLNEDEKKKLYEVIVNLK